MTLLGWSFPTDPAPPLANDLTDPCADRVTSTLHQRATLNTKPPFRYRYSTYYPASPSSSLHLIPRIYHRSPFPPYPHTMTSTPTKEEGGAVPAAAKGSWSQFLKVC